MSSKPQEAYTKYEVITQIDQDSDDLLIPIPPVLLEKLKWKENDPIEIRLDSNGRYIISRGQQ
jgi:antitoxin component of MazEF toxin-antitoxin module